MARLLAGLLFVVKPADPLTHLYLRCLRTRHPSSRSLLSPRASRSLGQPIIGLRYDLPRIGFFSCSQTADIRTRKLKTEVAPNGKEEAREQWTRWNDSPSRYAITGSVFCEVPTMELNRTV